MSHDSSPDITRRSFHGTALNSLLAFSAIDLLCRNDAFADEIKPVTVKWLGEVATSGNLERIGNFKPHHRPRAAKCHFWKAAQLG